MLFFRLFSGFGRICPCLFAKDVVYYLPKTKTICRIEFKMDIDLSKYFDTPERERSYALLTRRPHLETGLYFGLFLLGVVLFPLHAVWVLLMCAMAG